MFAVVFACEKCYNFGESVTVREMEDIDDSFPLGLDCQVQASPDGFVNPSGAEDP